MMDMRKKHAAPRWMLPLLPLLLSLLLAGCATIDHPSVKSATLSQSGSGASSVDQSKKPKAAKKSATPAAAVTPPPAIALRQRLLLPLDGDASMHLPAGSSQPLYAFKAKDLPITQALTMFARSYKLNIIVDPDVTGKVTVEFRDVPFDQAMEAMLRSLGYYWHREGDLVWVEARESRQFVLDFLATKGDNRIWGGLEAQLKTLLSDKGTLVVNKLTGTIQVTDAHPNIEAVAQFLNQLRQTISRQVEIEMKIVEVALNDDTSLGIDWNRINMGTLGLKVAFSSANAISAPAGGFTGLSPTITVNGGYTSKQGKGDINSVIQALSEQGKVKIISQPRIRALNNQPSLVKVGTDRTFITQEVTTTTGTSTSSSVGYKQQVVPEGLELNVTPQISANGWIMLDVKPKITRVSSVTEVKDAAGNVVSSGPNLDVRETQSMVRVQDNQTAVIGGLIQTTKSDTDRQVPLLSELPLLGNLFKGTYNKKRRTELVIFLTPHLIGPTGAVSNP